MIATNVGSTITSAWLPTACIVCADLGSRRLCAPCAARFVPRVPRCPRCALPLPTQVPACVACLREPPPFTSAVAACDYGFPWDEAITAFKSGAALDHASVLAQLMQQAVVNTGDRLPDVVVPIPCSRERARERGFHPAWELARRVASALRIDAQPQVLQRVVDTPRQRGLTRLERRANVRGAFVATARGASRVHGHSVALVDDVMTTTATAAEAARTLLAAGARDVVVWVAARTPD